MSAPSSSTRELCVRHCNRSRAARTRRVFSASCAAASVLPRHLEHLKQQSAFQTLRCDMLCLELSVTSAFTSPWTHPRQNPNGSQRTERLASPVSTRTRPRALLATRSWIFQDLVQLDCRLRMLSCCLPLRLARSAALTVETCVTLYGQASFTAVDALVKTAQLRVSASEALNVSFAVSANKSQINIRQEVASLGGCADGDKQWRALPAPSSAQAKVDLLVGTLEQMGLSKVHFGNSHACHIACSADLGDRRCAGRRLPRKGCERVRRLRSRAAAASRERDRG